MWSCLFLPWVIKGDRDIYIKKTFQTSGIILSMYQRFLVIHQWVRQNWAKFMISKSKIVNSFMKYNKKVLSFPQNLQLAFHNNNLQLLNITLPSLTNFHVSPSSCPRGWVRAVQLPVRQDSLLSERSTNHRRRPDRCRQGQTRAQPHRVARPGQPDPPQLRLHGRGT